MRRLTNTSFAKRLARSLRPAQDLVHVVPLLNSPGGAEVDSDPHLTLGSLLGLLAHMLRTDELDVSLCLIRNLVQSPLAEADLHCSHGSFQSQLPEFLGPYKDALSEQVIEAFILHTHDGGQQCRCNLSSAPHSVPPQASGSSRPTTSVPQASGVSAIPPMRPVRPQIDASQRRAQSSNDSAIPRVRRGRSTSDVRAGTAQSSNDSAIPPVRRGRSPSDASLRTAQSSNDSAIPPVRRGRSPSDASLRTAQSSKDSAIPPVRRARSPSDASLGESQSSNDAEEASPAKGSTDAVGVHSGRERAYQRGQPTTRSMSSAGVVATHARVGNIATPLVFPGCLPGEGTGTLWDLFGPGAPGERWPSESSSP